MNPGPRIKCPTCRKDGDWFATRFGPFCSERCKLVDLGKWLKEEIKISEPLNSEHLAEEVVTTEDRRQCAGNLRESSDSQKYQ
jgi:endogenous inhibitor of DNA gyrase (YacG/DUF329 family)